MSLSIDKYCNNIRFLIWRFQLINVTFKYLVEIILYEIPSTIVISTRYLILKDLF
jgi:hypothetical protein